MASKSNVIYQEAKNNINEIIFTNKTREIMRDESKVITIYGSTGNGKSMIATLKALKRIYGSDKSKKTFVLAGRDIITLEKRFVEGNYSVLNWRPFKGKWKYQKQGVGGSKIIFSTKTGEKRLYLTPFKDVSTYSRVLGQTIDGILVDEGVEADDLFLQEIIARTIRTKDTWYIGTSNGGDPKHFFYTGIVNKSKTLEDTMGLAKMAELGIRRTPVEEMKYFESEKHDSFMAYHMGLEDNPIYTGERLKTLYELYPSGSFMYYSRILGIRWFSQESPFSAYINEKTFIKLNEMNLEKNVEFMPFYMEYSVDSGGHVFSNKEMITSRYRDGDFGTEKGGHTIMVIGAFSKDYKRFLLVDTYFPNEMEQSQNVELINRKVYDWRMVFPNAIRQFMFCDPADSSMLSALMTHVRNVNEVRGATKRDTKLALDEKVVVSLVQQYLMKGHFKILDTENNRRWFYGAMLSAVQESDGKLVDNLSWEADVWDGLKYIFMSMYRILIQ